MRLPAGKEDEQSVTRRRQQRGFSVIEFMILVALLCIVAAIGVPNFIEMQYRAQRAEVPSNIEGIHLAALAYRAANGEVVAEILPRPDATPDNRARPWKLGSKFDELGWQPEGDVRGSYTLETTPSGTFVVKGICDVDANGAQAKFTASSADGIRSLTDPEVY